MKAIGTPQVNMQIAPSCDRAPGYMGQYVSNKNGKTAGSAPICGAISRRCDPRG